MNDRTRTVIMFYLTLFTLLFCLSNSLSCVVQFLSFLFLIKYSILIARFLYCMKVCISFFILFMLNVKSMVLLLVNVNVFVCFAHLDSGCFFLFCFFA